MNIGPDGKPAPRKAGEAGRRGGGAAGAPRKAPEPTDIDCPNCGKKMVIREGRFGRFLACSGYPKCKTTQKLGPDGNPA
jgi:DNA topoisomerase-1